MGVQRFRSVEEMPPPWRPANDPGNLRVVATMLALSRRLNPACEHVPGDMRSIRLGRVFDCVLVHEIVGRVTRVGSAVTAFKPGELAGVGCLMDSDRTCPNRHGVSQGRVAGLELEGVGDATTKARKQ
jgi:threonine dehydrogenase-like Zn-dependent dehydrogenase